MKEEIQEYQPAPSAVAFYPPSKGINLDNLTETAGHLSSLMWRRQRLNIAGLVAFVLGNLMGIVVVISHLVRVDKP